MSARSRALAVVALGLFWGGAVPSATAQVSVATASPSAASQGTSTLTVVITGKNFVKNARAGFYRTGTKDPGGVVVSRTTYKTATRVEAVVSIANSAALDYYDIEVLLPNGSTGTGKIAFAVTAMVADPCAMPDPVPTLNPLTASGPPGLPGYLDADFGAGGTGKAIGPRNFVGQLAGGIAIDSQSRFIVVGHLKDPCAATGSNNPFRTPVFDDNVWAVARFLPGGLLDEEFGEPDTPGIVTTAFAGSAWAADVVIDSTGRIVVVGSTPVSSKKGGSYNVPTVVRYSADGALDTTFGGTGTGIVYLPTGGIASTPKVVTLQSDGKIVLSAQDNYSGYLRLTRLTPAGTLDAGFGSSGQCVFDQFAAAVGDLAIDSQERIIVAGDARRPGFPNTGILWRFTPAGELDQAFGTAGMALTNVNGLPTGYASVAIDASGDLVATGNVYHPDGSAPTELALARYSPAGLLQWQVVVPGETRSSYGQKVAVVSDDRILVAGRKEAGTLTGDFALWRFDADGVLDATFGVGGWFVDQISLAALGNGTSFRDFVQQGDGKVVLAGDLWVGSMRVPYFFLARLWQ